jgi:hypothetical protein
MAAVFFQQVLQVTGFSGGATLGITAQGIDDFDAVAFLTDEKVTTLCKTVQKPGGVVVGHAITLTSESICVSFGSTFSGALWSFCNCWPDDPTGDSKSSIAT